MGSRCTGMDRKRPERILLQRMWGYEIAEWKIIWIISCVDKRGCYNESDIFVLSGQKRGTAKAEIVEAD